MAIWNTWIPEHNAHDSGRSINADWQRLFIADQLEGTIVATVYILQYTIYISICIDVF